MSFNKRIAAVVAASAPIEAALACFAPSASDDTAHVGGEVIGG